MSEWLILAVLVSVVCSPFALMAWIFYRAGEVNRRSMEDHKRRRE